VNAAMNLPCQLHVGKLYISRATAGLPRRAQLHGVPGDGGQEWPKHVVDISTFSL
jgi:hypothetical protein